MLLLLFLGSFDGNIDFTARLFDEPVVILEVEVNLSGILSREIVECFFDSIIIDS